MSNLRSSTGNFLQLWLINTPTASRDTTTVSDISILEQE